MKYFNSILKGTFVLFILLQVSACDEEESEDKLKHSAEFNMISSVDNVIALASYDFLKVMDESQIKNSEHVPIEFRMMIKAYTGMALNSDKMGFNLEGNNHIVFVGGEKGQIDYGFLTAEVNNKKRVKKGLKEYIKGSPKEKDGFMFLEDKYNNMVAGWDSAHVVIAYSDSEDKDLVAQITSILKARAKDGKDNKDLENYLGRDDDMNYFVFMDEMMDFAKDADENNQFNEEYLALFDGVYLQGSGNFEVGEIVFEMDMLNGDALKNSEYNTIGSNPVSADFLNYVTDNNLLFFGTAALNMDAMFSMMDMVESKEDPFGELKKLGFSEDQLKTMFTGEVALSVIDVSMMANPLKAQLDELVEEEDDFFADMESGYVPSEIPMPKIVLSVGLNDTNGLVSLLNTGGEMLEGGYFQVEEMTYVVLTPDKLILTTSEAAAQLFGSGGKYPTYNMDGGASIDAPLFGHFNVKQENLPEGITNVLTEMLGEGTADILGMFESVNFSGSIDGAKMTIIMKNKSDNAAKVMVDEIFGNLDIDPMDML